MEQKKIIDAHTWIDAAQKLNTLIGDEHDKLVELQHNIAVFKAACMADGATAAHAKVQSESLPEYKEMMRQKARIGRIEEMIRIAKLQARLKDNEYRNQ